MKSVLQRLSRIGIGVAAFVVMLTLVPVLAPTEAHAQCTYGWGIIYVTAPATGATFTTGTNATISYYGDRYTIGNYGGKYGVEYSSNGGASWTNITSTVDGYARSYTWAIPAGLTPGTNYRIRVREVPGPSWSCSFSNPGVSGQFTIVKGCFAPTISSQPTSRTVCVNTSTTFTVGSSLATADGVWEWRKDGNPIPGANSASYTIASVQTSDAGVYDCVLKDICDPVKTLTTTSSAQLTVLLPPAITSSPAGRTICENANDTLRVRSTGAARTFQWFKDGVAIAGARDSNYIINNAGTSAIGVYTCTVSGTCAPSATTPVCSVLVALRPRVTQEPTNLDICPGTTGSLTVAASGLNLVYQWYRNGVAVSNAFNSTLTFSNYAYDADGQYYCLITSNIPNPNNCVVTAQTRTVRVSGFRPPKVKESPRSLDACVGTNVTLVSDFAGTGLQYQWFRNGVAILGASSNSLTLTNVTAANSGKYVSVATGTCDLTAKSDTATITVIAKPKLTTQPTNQNLEVGQRLELSVAGSDARTIQWTKNDQPITGATANTFVIASVTKGDAGLYNARITNSCGGVSSAYANVTVKDPTVPEPVLELSQTGIEFGEIPVGYDKSITAPALIKNIGTAPMTVSVLTATPSEFSISNAPALPLTLNPGEAQSITIKATPTNKGNLAGTLNIRTNAPASPSANVALTAAYVLRYDHAASEDFGTVLTDTPAERCVRLTNTSALDIAIEQVTFTGMDAGLFTTVTTLPLQIAAGQNAELCVKFAPATAGNKAATMNVRSSNGGNSSISLSGKGEVPGGVIDAVEAGISAWPNPMTDRVEVRFSKPTPAMNVSVVSTSGATVAAFTHDGVEGGGSIRWNGRDAAGSLVASGTYTMIIRYGDVSVAVPLTVVR